MSVSAFWGVCVCGPSEGECTATAVSSDKCDRLLQRPTILAGRQSYIELRSAAFGLGVPAGSPSLARVSIAPSHPDGQRAVLTRIIWQLLYREFGSLHNHDQLFDVPRSCQSASATSAICDGYVLPG